MVTVLRRVIDWLWRSGDEGWVMPGNSVTRAIEASIVVQPPPTEPDLVSVEPEVVVMEDASVEEAGKRDTRAA